MFIFVGLQSGFGIPKHRNWFKQEREIQRAKLKQQEQSQGQGQSEGTETSFRTETSESQKYKEPISIDTRKHSEKSLLNTVGDSVKSSTTQSEQSGLSSAVVESNEANHTGVSGIAPYTQSGTGLPVFPAMYGHFSH